jgi:phosphoenolpyruvate carboxylase
LTPSRASTSAAARRAAVLTALQAEFARTEAAILRLTHQSDLLENERWLRRSIQLRNPYIDPLNYVQVAVLCRLAGSCDANADPETLAGILALTVNGIAAGLRNTG